MSGADDGTSRDDAEIRAAETALGLLGGDERREAERRLRGDAAFAEAVGRWDERFAPLLSGIADVEPPPLVWQGIERDLARMTRIAPAPVANRRAAGGRAVGEGAADVLRGLVPAFWRTVALGVSGLLAASLVGLVVLSLPRPAPQPLTASISGEGAGSVPLYTAVVYPGAAGATLIPVGTASAPGHSHELWMIAPGNAPRSLGVLRPGTLRIEIAPELLAEGGVLAISLEPIGGSPTGQPTGPVVAKGELHGV